MGQELMNAAGFKKGMAAKFREHGMSEESLADGIGGGYPLIRYAGKEWKLQVRGDVHQFTGPDGYGSPYIDVIILRQARNKSKAYFPDWEEGSKDAPVCSSLDGVVPDPGVEDKQSDTCAMCKRNVFKKNEKGMMVKECSDAKRLAVLPLPSQTKKLLGEPLVEPVFLRVPAASLQNLAQMGENARKQGYEFWSYITRISFDPEKNYPKMVFKAIQELSDAEADKILELREDLQAYRIVSGEIGGAVKTIEPATLLAPARDTGLVATPGPLLDAAADATMADKVALAAKLAADTAARKEAIRAEAAAKEAAEYKAAAEAAAAKAQPKVLELKANPETVDTGLGAPSSPTPGPENTASDTGEPEQADAALDAAIAAFMPRS